ncbi:MAG: hypothetical protein ABI844_16175 [Saprospiraceae bacterium]
MKSTETILINTRSKSDKLLILQIAKKLGLKSKTLTALEKKDWELAQKIELGLKTNNVSREEIMKALK